jgi:hypothetical protein
VKIPSSGGSHFNIGFSEGMDNNNKNINMSYLVRFEVFTAVKIQVELCCFDAV